MSNFLSTQFFLILLKVNNAVGHPLEVWPNGPKSKVKP